MSYLTKGEFVYKILRDRVFSGEFKKDRIYKVVEIAEELGVSRTPVSEAVKILASQGYLVMLPGVGFKVKSLTSEEVDEILLISGVLEKLAIEMLIQKGSNIDIEGLRENLDKCRKAVKDKDIDEYAKLTDQFHKTLYSGSGLPKLVEVLDNVSIHEALYQESVIRNPEAILVLINDHHLLLDIIEQKQVDKIEVFMERHTCNCKRTHESYL